MNQQIQQLNKLIQELKMEKSELIIQNAHLIEKAQDEIKTIKASNISLSDKFKQILDENEIIKTENISLSDKIKQILDENEIIKTEKSSLSDKNNELQEKINVMEDKIKGLRNIQGMYKNNIMKLGKKDEDLKKINKHNYLLIKEMKNLLIEEGELNENEKKLGGIDMVKKAFEKKNETIKELRDRLANPQNSFNFF